MRAPRNSDEEIHQIMIGKNCCLCPKKNRLITFEFTGNITRTGFSYMSTCLALIKTEVVFFIFVIIQLDVEHLEQL